MQASKWLDSQLLLSESEMQALVSHLEPFQIFLTGRVAGGEIALETFLRDYNEYVNALKEGKVPQALTAVVWTLTPDVVQAQQLSGGRELLKLVAPAVQLQPHAMIYSEHDGKFHTMVYGKGSILWGYQISYPQLYLDPKTKEVMKVDSRFPNTALFRKIQLWIRHHTIPTPMQTPTGALNLSVRLGKECLNWINHHPQLKHLECK